MKPQHANLHAEVFMFKKSFKYLIAEVSSALLNLLLQTGC